MPQAKVLFVAVLAVTMLNGLTSPALPGVMYLAPIWLPDFIEPSREAVFYGATLIVAIATLMLSGVPAALFERLRGQRESTSESMLVWLACAVLLSLPAIL